MKALLCLPFVLLTLSPPAAPQSPAFQTPGTPVYPTQPAGRDDYGQNDRFASVFNPAFSFIVDTAVDYVDYDSSAEDSGFDAQLRIFEAAAQAWVDPSAWAYFVGAAEEEELAIEEAAIHYIGWGNSTIRAGRFFIDFGKQMQIHVHELRTLERPLALRAYLGGEVRGDGVQWDHWTPVGDETILRWSIGAFANLLPEESDFVDLEREIDDRKDFADLNFTGRVTGFGDVGTNGLLQVGASMRAIPEYTVVDEANSIEQSGLENTVYGLDLTYAWIDDTGQDTLTLGTEVLLASGDTGFSVTDPDSIPGTGDESLTVLDDSVFGYYAFVDWAWNRFHSSGCSTRAPRSPMEPTPRRSSCTTHAGSPSSIGCVWSWLRSRTTPAKTLTGLPFNTRASPEPTVTESTGRKSCRTSKRSSVSSACSCRFCCRAPSRGALVRGLAVPCASWSRSRIWPTSCARSAAIEWRSLRSRG